MTDPNILREFTQKVITLAEAENVMIPDLVRSLQQNIVAKHTGTLPVIRRMSTTEATDSLIKRDGPVTFEDFYLYIQALNDSELAYHELSQIKRRGDREYPKYFLTVSADKSTVGLMRQDHAQDDPVTYAIFTFEFDSRMVILARVINGEAEQIATPYRISFDTLVGGNTTSWQYVFNYQGAEIKDILNKSLTM